MTNQFTLRGIAIILLTLAAAFIHFSLLFPDALFILNGLGFLALLFVYFLRTDLSLRYHSLIHWVFIGYTVITILAWIAIGDKSWPAGALGYTTVLIEIALVILLFLDRDS
jgi:hypothetical protein